MPTNAPRRALILDTAIDILVDAGSREVSHRKIDERARLPAGTTSNYFRTHRALLEGAARRLAELHWQHVRDLQAGLLTRGDRDAVVVLLARLIDDPDIAARRRQVARFEIFLEGLREPQLRPFLDDIHAAAVESARAVLAWGGLSPTRAEVERLTQVLSGLTFSRLTAPSRDLEGRALVALVDRLLDLPRSESGGGRSLYEMPYALPETAGRPAPLVDGMIDSAHGSAGAVPPPRKATWRSSANRRARR